MSKKVDPIVLDLIENALLNARFEMDSVVVRVALSPVIREQHDEFPMICDPAGRMIVGDIEHGGDTGLFGFAPDQPCFVPLAQGEAKGIQQDRFAGAGFAGQHR